MNPWLYLFCIGLFAAVTMYGFAVARRIYQRDRERLADNQAAGINGVIALFARGKIALVRIWFVQLAACLVVGIMPYFLPERLPTTAGLFWDVWREIALLLSPIRLGIQMVATIVLLLSVPYAILGDDKTFQRARRYQRQQAERLGLMDEDDQV